MIVYVLSKPTGAFGAEIQELELVEQSSKFVAFLDRQGHVRRISGKPNRIANMNPNHFGYSMSKQGARALVIAWLRLKMSREDQLVAKAEKEISGAKYRYAKWLESLEQMNQLAAIDAPLCKKFGVDFHSAGGALTLRPSDIGEHPSGWVVSGEIKEDYYLWVNQFEATHPTLGRVWGDFEDQVFYTSIEAYDDFRKYFNPEDWDYQDI